MTKERLAEIKKELNKLEYATVFGGENLTGEEMFDIMKAFNKLTKCIDKIYGKGAK